MQKGKGAKRGGGCRGKFSLCVRILDWFKTDSALHYCLLLTIAFRLR